jgi:hypothetical protein
MIVPDDTDLLLRAVLTGAQRFADANLGLAIKFIKRSKMILQSTAGKGEQR